MTMTISIPTRAKDVQIAEIGSNTLILRSRTWERLKFEIEYSRQKGTTANSYLILGDKIALIDPPGESFTDIFLIELAKNIDYSSLNYIILGHINSNRLATLKVLLEKAAQIQIICSRPGANFLKTAFPDWERQIIPMRTDDRLDLGKNHHLQFITTPTPRWPDNLCTYDSATQILYTDKFFGAHVCQDAIFDEDWKALDGDRHYYFDCLHADQSKQVEAALDKMTALSTKMYAPNHGSVVRYSLSRFSYDYRQWCQKQKSQDLKVALLYASAYGNTTIAANAIAQGLIKQGIQVESINCENADTATITQAIKACDGFIIGSPTLAGHAPTQIQTALGIILSTATKTKLAGVFGSYGWSGEAIDMLENKLKDANYRLGFNSLMIRFSPTPEILQECEEAGAEFAQNLKKNKKLRTPIQSFTQANRDRTEQATGRIISSLCVVTTKQGETHRGLLTSSVSQASFNPPGLIIALGEQQNRELMCDLGDKFVLNILKEGKNVRRYFSTQYNPYNDPFSHLTTRIANNGCLIINEALAYLECTVQFQQQCGDSSLIYALIDKGEVLETEGVTAVVRIQN